MKTTTMSTELSKQGLGGIVVSKIRFNKIISFKSSSLQSDLKTEKKRERERESEIAYHCLTE